MPIKTHLLNCSNFIADSIFSIIYCVIVGDWPIGIGNEIQGPVIGVKSAGGRLQGNLLLKSMISKMKFRARRRWVESKFEPL